MLDNLDSIVAEMIIMPELCSSNQRKNKHSTNSDLLYPVSAKKQVRSATSKRNLNRICLSVTFIAFVLFRKYQK